GRGPFGYFCVLAKVTRCKSGTLLSHHQNNGYAPKINQPNTTNANICVDAYAAMRPARAIKIKPPESES
ncbi:hypothetical protein, partial [Pseudomonas fluorescens]|uniref:hypothetical protein n=1 Tax=Pseudomonas fluorescens TaxID=294 RepID=UPI001A91D390